MIDYVITLERFVKLVAGVVVEFLLVGTFYSWPLGRMMS